MVVVFGPNSVWQKTCRLKRLERGKVNRFTDLYASAAGKGSNLCRALAILGVPAELHAYIGGATGDAFAKACHDDGLLTCFTKIAGETRICTTLIEDDTTMTELVEPGPPLQAVESDAAFAHVVERLATARMLAIGGTAMSGEREDCYARLVRAAHEHNVPTVLDSCQHHARLALDAGPAVLKINRDELAELSGMAVATREDRMQAYAQLHKQTHLAWIVITHGPEGAEGYNGQCLVEVQPPAVTSVNPIGSGDSATAGLIRTILTADAPVARWRGDDDLLEQAVLHAVSAGTANCLERKPGFLDPAMLKQIAAACQMHRLPAG